MLLLSLVVAPSAWPQKAERLYQTTAAISMGADSTERRSAITRVLESSDIAFQLEDFVDPRMRKGTNVVATIPGRTSNSVLLGAHYDRVAVGQGALDNGASCAVLLDLLQSFKTMPLPNLTLRVVFFDLEEGGLSGSQAYFARMKNSELPLYAINLDIFGYGDSIFATASKEGTLSAALTRAAAATGLPVQLLPAAQYPSSDHRNMMAAGVETIGMSLLDASEIDGVVGVITRRSTTLPPVLSVIHTAKDTLSVIRPGEMDKAMPFLEKMIRALDQ